jgi:hypothetical protein
MAAEPARDEKIQEFWLAAGIALFALLAFYFSTKPIQQHFDYTGRIALALIHGHLGVQSRPPSWLNEMVPLE